MKKTLKFLLAIITLPIYLPICMLIGIIIGLIEGLELAVDAFDSIGFHQLTDEDRKAMHDDYY